MRWGYWLVSARGRSLEPPGVGSTGCSCGGELTGTPTNLCSHRAGDGRYSLLGQPLQYNLALCPPPLLHSQPSYTSHQVRALGGQGVAPTMGGGILRDGGELGVTTAPSGALGKGGLSPATLASMGVGGKLARE